MDVDKLVKEYDELFLAFFWALLVPVGIAMVASFLARLTGIKLGWWVLGLLGPPAYLFPVWAPVVFLMFYRGKLSPEAPERSFRKRLVMRGIELVFLVGSIASCIGLLKLGS